jgi:hypothetical protein
MNQHHRFSRALGRLQHWHSDATKAQALAGKTTSSKPESKELRSRHYPGTRDALDRWRDGDEGQREELIEELEAEFSALFKRRHATVTFRDHWGKTRYRLVDAPGDHT